MNKKSPSTLNNDLCSHPDHCHEIENCTGTIHGLEDEAVQVESLEGDSPDDSDVPSSAVIQYVFGIAPSGLTQDGGSSKLLTNSNQLRIRWSSGCRE